MRRIRMIPILVFVFVLVGVASMSCQQKPDGTPPPIAEKKPHRLEMHGDVRVDDYYWLREREDHAVIAYLEAENAYTEARLAHLASLRETLFDEIVGRIKKDDASVPYRYRDHWYYRRYVEDGEYPVYCRKAGSPEGDEEVLLDVNALAAGKEFFSAAGLAVSENSDILAYATDDVGRRLYVLRFKNLTTGQEYPEAIPDVSPGVAWAADNRTAFYVRKDPETLRPWQVWRHVVGTDPAEDVLVYQEDDEEFLIGVTRLKSRKFVAIGSFQTLSTEWRVLPSDRPQGEFRVIQPRERDHEYDIDHFGDHFYIRTNKDAKNFRLVKAPVESPGMDHWVEVLPHRDDTLLEGFELFRDHLVAVERTEGLVQLRVRPWNGSGEHYVDFGEPAYVAYPMDNAEIDSGVLRFGYESLTTPESVFDYDLATREKTLLKEEEVLGGFDRTDYVTERLWAPARDGVRVPISLVYRKGFERNGTAPLLLYGYGSYGNSIDPTFSSARLSLLDRGFVFAIAHIRGGEEMGRAWYESGKLLKKMNTFTDFIDCGDHLVREKYAAPDGLYGYGGSAGGLLTGAVMNLRPEMWAGIVSRVPFVDVVTTMLDPDIPLTTFEYDEWGNPNDPEYYRYMLSYSPYDNVEAKDYPPTLVTAGLHDSQVQYWEPAKWVAKLRAMKTDDHLLLLHTNMEAGHGGASGRFKSQRETALYYAFLLDLAGKAS